jgi:hypothetical protein
MDVGDEGEMEQPVGLSMVEDAIDKKARKRAEREARKRAMREARKRGSRGGGLAVLGAIGIVLIGNSCMLSMAVPLDFWAIYEYGWPIELFLATLALFGIMYVTSSIWLLIPAGLIFGTGALLTYSSLTNQWEHWVFLWICQVWVVIGSVWAPIWLARNRRLAGGLSRLIAIVGGLLSLALIVGIGAAAGVGSLLGDLARVLNF